MKFIKISLVILLLFTFNSYAQSVRNMILKTNNGEKFIAYINQEQINQQPLNEIAITGLVDDYYRVELRTVTNKVLQNQLYAAPFSEIIYVFNAKHSFQKQNYYILDIYPVQPNAQYSNLFYLGQNSTNQNNEAINNTGVGQINININNQANVQNATVIPEPIIVPEPIIIYVEGYEGEIGCDIPLSKKRFNSMLNVIAEQDFASTKKRIAKQIIGNNCFLTSQIMQILSLFDFENNKVSIAKFAYDHTYDLENYYKVNTVFDFDSSKRSLDKYIRNR